MSVNFLDYFSVKKRSLDYKSLTSSSLTINEVSNGAYESSFKKKKLLLYCLYGIIWISFFRFVSSLFWPLKFDDDEDNELFCRDPHHLESPTRYDQNLKLLRTRVQALLNEVVQ